MAYTPDKETRDYEMAIDVWEAFVFWNDRDPFSTDEIMKEFFLGSLDLPWDVKKIPGGEKALRRHIDGFIRFGF